MVQLLRARIPLSDALGLPWYYVYSGDKKLVLAITKWHARLIVRNMRRLHRITSAEAKDLLKQIEASELPENMKEIVRAVRRYQAPPDHKFVSALRRCSDNDCPLRRMTGLVEANVVFHNQGELALSVEDVIRTLIEYTNHPKDPMPIADAIVTIIKAVDAEMPLRNDDVEKLIASKRAGRQAEIRMTIAMLQCAADRLELPHSNAPLIFLVRVP